MKLLLLALVAACGTHGNDSKKTSEPVATKGDAGRVLLPNDAATQAQLPPAPPLPDVPFGLPPVPAGVLDGVTPELVQQGQLAFGEACATCHDPANHFVALKEDAPQLVNLAWDKATMAKLPAHAADVKADPAKLPALTAFVLTRYSGDSEWDHKEREAQDKTDREVIGYHLFSSKGCATCHTPPLYTDLRVHDIGEKRQTRGLRGVGQRTAVLFRTHAAKSLGGALGYYTIDHPGGELKKLTLSQAETDNLVVFLKALDGK
ncbi:MAG: hypothetical protein QM831_46665 [Kofleriaceae bacterium]